MAFLLGLALGMAASVPTQYAVMDYRSGRQTLFPLTAAPIAGTPPSPGSDGGRPLALPRTGPVPPLRTSRFSTLLRARDLFDLSAFPARSIAKLHRLNADGSRAAAACTAQFVGPRHLITAAHCVVDRSRGVFHPGFELAVRHDAGQAQGGTLRITRAWVVTAQMLQSRPEDHIVTPGNCADTALIEVAEPAGARLGWLGMAGQQDPLPPILHRFSYPHQSAADLVPAGAPDAQGMEREMEAMRTTEADFSPRNLYYEFGAADEAEGVYVADRNGYVLPGRSGSALITPEGRIVAILSRGYQGTMYSCRLSAEEIGEFVALMRS